MALLLTFGTLNNQIENHFVRQIMVLNQSLDAIILSPRKPSHNYHPLVTFKRGFFVLEICQNPLRTLFQSKYFKCLRVKWKNCKHYKHQW